MTALRNVAAIVGKEWRHYFGSPIAWVALFVWTILFGIFFYFAFTFFLEQSMRVAQQGMEMGGGGMKLSLNEYLIRPLFHNMAVVALFIAPMLTMRLFAEEKRQGTIELLATSPVTDLQIVIGKFLAAAGLYALMILAGLVNVALIWTYATSPPEWKPILTGALGLFLLGCCFLAMGIFVSTLTRTRSWPASSRSASSSGCGRSAGRTTRRAARSRRSWPTSGVTTHLEDLVKGVVDLKDVVFYLSVITFGLFLAHQSVREPAVEGVAP